MECGGGGSVGTGRLVEFTLGQRWYSSTEPELGLGRVEAVEGRQVVIAFPARDMVRRYAGEDPPLVRARLNAGQTARGLSVEFAVEEVVADGALLVYRGGGEQLAEGDLDADLTVGEGADAGAPERGAQELSDAPRRCLLLGPAIPPLADHSGKSGQGDGPDGGGTSDDATSEWCPATSPPAPPAVPGAPLPPP